MEFTELLEEWLELRDVMNSDEEDMRQSIKRTEDINRMADITDEINKRMRGEI